MKWYSIKKYIPTLDCSLTLVRMKIKSIDHYYFVLAEYDNGWKDWEHKEDIEDNDNKVTHFCILDPVEVEE